MSFITLERLTFYALLFLQVNKRRVSILRLVCLENNTCHASNCSFLDKFQLRILNFREHHLQLADLNLQSVFRPVDLRQKHGMPLCQMSMRATQPLASSSMLLEKVNALGVFLSQAPPWPSKPSSSLSLQAHEDILF